jgi:hypothetical protein
MKTTSETVMILKTPLNKWDKKNRATDNDPHIAIFFNRNDKEGLLMTSKLRTILRDYGERVAISNSLVSEILNAYIKKSKQLKRAEKRIAELESELAYAHDDTRGSN